ncbi:MAG: Chitobiose ABC transporter, ATP-binding protein 2, partial [uncultured Nocardioidaceae bacterium]
GPGFGPTYTGAGDHRTDQVLPGGRAAPVGAGPRVGGRLVHDWTGRGGRGGGGVGQRQEHDRPPRRPPDAADLGDDQAQRPGRAGVGAEAALAGLQGEGPDGLPGPVRLAEPRPLDWAPPRPAAQDPRQGAREGRDAGQDPRAAGDGRAQPAGGLRPQVPARALGRAAAAGRDRAGAGGGPGPAAGRRADLDAGRLDPDGRPQPDGAAEGGAGAQLSLHHPRPGERAVHRRPDARHVRRADGGGRAERGAGLGAGPPVHQAAAVGGAEPGRGADQDQRPRRGAVAGEPAPRLPLRLPLPGRDGRLPPGDARHRARHRQALGAVSPVRAGGGHLVPF